MTDPATSDPGTWRPRAAALAAAVAAAHPVRDRRWLAAVRDTPRGEFVPLFYRQRDTDRSWEQITHPDPRWLDGVYQDIPLITALLPDRSGNPSVVSSSTKPALMVRMLDALDPHDGDRVLEIGTGTGYNAALLAHRLGAEHVHTIDIGAQLVDQARARLRSLGYQVTAETGDGLQGLPEHGPYDRIIATCSVPAIPWAWAEQLCPGGAVLADVKVGMHAGNLALLTREADRLTGAFLPKWAGFMPARPRDTAPEPATTAGTIGEPTGSTSTTIDPDPWTALVPWFLAQIGHPPITGYGRRGPRLTLTRIATADGAWCDIGQPDNAGVRTVHYGGERNLWTGITNAHQEWAGHGRPGWDRLGLTVTPDGKHTVWLDNPSHIIRGWNAL